MRTTTAIIPTEHASRYLQQLCKHWSHKFTVTFDPEAGEIALPFGRTILRADPKTLTVAIELNQGADGDRARAVVAEHLNRFAFREGELVFDWRS